MAFILPIHVSRDLNQTDQIGQRVSSNIDAFPVFIGDCNLTRILAKSFQVEQEGALQGHCVKSCPENAIGLLLYRLVITNALLLNVVGVAQTLLLRCFFPQLCDPPEARNAATIFYMQRNSLHSKDSVAGLVHSFVTRVRMLADNCGDTKVQKCIILYSTGHLRPASSRRSVFHCVHV